MNTKNALMLCLTCAVVAAAACEDRADEPDSDSTAGGEVEREVNQAGENIEEATEEAADDVDEAADEAAE